MMNILNFLNPKLPAGASFDVKDASGESGGDLTLTMPDWDLDSSGFDIFRSLTRKSNF